MTDPLLYISKIFRDKDAIKQIPNLTFYLRGNILSQPRTLAIPELGHGKTMNHIFNLITNKQINPLFKILTGPN